MNYKDLKIGMTVVIDNTQCVVDELDDELETAYVFDYINYNGGWVAATDIEEKSDEEKHSTL